MLEFLLKLLEQLNSSVFTLILIFIIAFWSVYKLGQIIESHKGSLKSLDDFKERVYEKFDHVDQRFHEIERKFEKVDARFEKVDARFERLESKLFEVDATLKLLYEAFIKKFNL